jgi:hypothetical protein
MAQSGEEEMIPMAEEKRFRPPIRAKPVVLTGQPVAQL